MAKECKKPYLKPRLVRHGDLRSLTQGGGKGKTEAAGGPKTKFNASPG